MNCGELQVQYPFGAVEFDFIQSTYLFTTLVVETTIRFTYFGRLHSLSGVDDLFDSLLCLHMAGRGRMAVESYRRMKVIMMRSRSNGGDSRAFLAGLAEAGERKTDMTLHFHGSILKRPRRVSGRPLSDVDGIRLWGRRG